MCKFKNFFILLLLFSVLFSSVVFATVSEAEPTVSIVESQTTSAPEQNPTTINEDVFVSNDSSYSLSDIINGNIFASTNKFITNPRNNGGIINGNVFLISQNAIIESDVSYSNNTDKNGNAIIDSINSKSVINGNVYVLADSLTIEAGSEIHGDIYAIANSVNIEANVVVDGSIFVISTDITLNGQIKGSVYAQVRNFNMDFYCYIQNDLNLNTFDASLDGIVYRNAYITASNSLTTLSNFKVNSNLTVNYANDFVFSGKVGENAKINAKNLTLKNDNSICSINGDLNYATFYDTEIPNGIIKGNVSTSEFVESSSNSTFSISSCIFGLLTLLAYVFVVVFLAKLFAKNALDKLPEFTISNAFKNLGLGFASFFVIFIVFIVLCFSSIGVTLAFFMVAAYLFLLGLALPLFLHKIANLLKFNVGYYVKLLITVTVFYIISLIPILGSCVQFIALIIGIGQLLSTLLNRKK